MNCLLSIILLGIVARTAAILCNGNAGLCFLDITKVTLAGSHNSGAGFDGILNYHTVLGKVAALSCFYRNQDKDFTAQLNLGIRYFDLDTCWDKSNSPWICHSKAYGGSVSKMLSQIDNWMNDPKNRNEVIVIHFNREYEESNKNLIGDQIIKMLAAKWEPTSDKINRGELTMQTNLFVKLGDAIKTNQRIFVIMHSGLSAINPKSYLFNQHTVGYTWTTQTWVTSKGCLKLIEAMGEERCAREAYHDFVRYDLYLTSGLCVADMSKACNRYIDQGVAECFKGTLKRRKTVNFIVVDYVDERVVEAAKQQNIKNVQMYLNSDI